MLKTPKNALEETTDHEESCETELILKEGKKADLEGQVCCPQAAFHSHSLPSDSWHVCGIK